ncbi:MAG: hypothetical protein FWG83_07855, partial [Oscillospiraceae bacterium]|nr:hypothetical protein [Oscillospiraceae bacterium]
MLLLIITAIVLFIIFLKTHSKHKKPVQAATANMIMGVVSLVLASSIFSVTVNVYTVFISLTLGI